MGKILQQLAADEDRPAFDVLSDPAARTRPTTGRDLARAVVLVGVPISAALGALWMLVSYLVAVVIGSAPDELGVIVGVWLAPVAGWLSCAGAAIPLSSQRLRVRLHRWSAVVLAVVIGGAFFGGGAVVVTVVCRLADPVEWFTVLTVFSIAAVLLKRSSYLRPASFGSGPPAPEQFISALKPAPEVYADLDHSAEGLLALVGQARAASRKR